MSRRLTIAEVDRLLDVLDNRRTGTPPHDEIAKLQRAYVSARRLEERARVIYGVAIIAFSVAVLVSLFANGASDMPAWVQPAMMVMIALHLVAMEVLQRTSPVLRRRERVVLLLEYFEADVAGVDNVYARRTAPSNVLAAIETLERAKDPADLGPAFSVVERWSGRAHGISFDDIYLGFFWLVAIIIAFSGDQIGISGFWRGVAAGVAGMVVLHHYNSSRGNRDIRDRAENALGRWRHLVPRMRELPR